MIKAVIKHILIRFKRKSLCISMFSVPPWFFVTLFLLSACHPTSIKTDEPVPPLVKIDLTDHWANPQEVKLSTIVDSIFYIPLETRPGSFIGGQNGVDIVLLDQYLLVYENNKTLKLFSRTGKYLLTFGGQGKGPGEYIEARDFACDEPADRVYILDGNQRKIIVFDFKGNLKDEIRTSRWPCEITVSPDHEIGVLYLAFRTTIDSARLEWLTPEGALKNRIPLYQNRLPAATATWGSTSLYWIDGKLRIIEPPFDTIHQLDPVPGFKGVTSIIAGQGGIPREIWFNEMRWQREASNYYIVARVFETRGHTFVVSNGKRFCHFMYNKSTKVVKQVGAASSDRYWSEGLINDLDGGLPFWPQSASGDYLIRCLSYHEIKSYFEQGSGNPANSLVNPLWHKRFVSMAKELKEFDNPVVVVVRMKK